MGLLSWILVGLIAGALAKFVVPGNDPGGCIATTLLGVVGAVVGGFVAAMFGAAGVTRFDVSSILWATLGAVVVLVIYKAVTSR